MSLLGKKKVINPTLFNDRLASIKAVFKGSFMLKKKYESKS